MSKVLESLDQILEAENEETSQIHKCAINRKLGASKHKYSMLEHTTEAVLNGAEEKIVNAKFR